MNFAGDGFVYKDTAGKTTEWEDTLVRHGIIEENPQNVARREALEAAEEAVAELRDPETRRNAISALVGGSLPGGEARVNSASSRLPL